MNANEPAFPTGRIKGRAAGYEIVLDGDNPGLTKREYFAAMAMQGLIKPAYDSCVTNVGVIARDAIRIADALIAELSNEHG